MIVNEGVAHVLIQSFKNIFTLKARSKNERKSNRHFQGRKNIEIKKNRFIFFMLVQSGCSNNQHSLPNISENLFQLLPLTKANNETLLN